jgi:hypothetical protein
MWSITMSPAVATTMAHQQTLDAVRSARRAQQARLAAEGREPQGDPTRSFRRSRPRWTRVLAGHTAH